MPTFRHGKNTSVVYDKYDLSSMLNSVTYNASADLAETTGFGQGARTYIPGFPGGNVSAAGMFSGASATDIDPVLSAALSGTASVPMSIMVEGSGTVARRSFLCKVWDTAYNVTSPVSDVVAVTAEFSYDDKMDSGFILKEIGAISASATDPGTSGKQADTTTTLSTGFVAHLHMITNTRDAGSIAVKLQDSTTGAGASFSDVTGGAFTSVNFGVTSSERIFSASQTVRRYVGVSYTVTAGSSGSYTFVVTFAKR